MQVKIPDAAVVLCVAAVVVCDVAAPVCVVIAVVFSDAVVM